MPKVGATTPSQSRTRAPIGAQQETNICSSCSPRGHLAPPSLGRGPRLGPKPIEAKRPS